MYLTASGILEGPSRMGLVGGLVSRPHQDLLRAGPAPAQNEEGDSGDDGEGAQDGAHGDAGLCATREAVRAARNRHGLGCRGGRRRLEVV